ncbi:MAG: methyltransferase domain-containing protein [Pseudomonadota bacterium]
MRPAPNAMACHEDRAIHLYDRLAPTYDRLHQRWLRFSGGEAQAALEAAIRVEIRPHSQLLDVGCGTGRFARRLISEGVSPEQITLLDPSQAMLSRCADLAVEKTCGRLETLPFPNASFDIVTCAWAIETLPERYNAVDELARVLRPGGLLCLTFCAQKPPHSFADWVMQRRLASRGTGRFLDIDSIQDAVASAMPCDTWILPCAGTAATLIARRHQTSRVA